MSRNRKDGGRKNSGDGPKNADDRSGPSKEAASVRRATMHDRLVYLTLNLIGQRVAVQVKGGDMFDGIFHTANVDKDYSVVLKFARRRPTEAERKANKIVDNKIVKNLVIRGSDIVQVIAHEVSFLEDVLDKRVKKPRDAFTDTEISGGFGHAAGRQLQKWAPDDEGLGDGGLGSTTNSRGGSKGWDQFAANEQLFGVKTSYEEELYTTKLDKKSKLYQEMESKAARLAREIERQGTTNPHLMEERGKELNLDDMDEEDRYGAVVRDTPIVPPPEDQKAEQSRKQQTPPPVAPIEVDDEPEEDLIPSSSDGKKPSFSWNVNAKEFKPSSTPTSPPPPAQEEEYFDPSGGMDPQYGGQYYHQGPDAHQMQMYQQQMYQQQMYGAPRMAAFNYQQQMAEQQYRNRFQGGVPKEGMGGGGPMMGMYPAQFAGYPQGMMRPPGGYMPHPQQHGYAPRPENMGEGAPEDNVEG